jgi:transcription antitermination factor NusG
MAAHPETTCSAEDGEAAQLFAGHWWVLHTRARHEKAIARTLLENGVMHYLPLLHLQRTYGKRRVHVEIPLFPGYLFLSGGTSEVELARRTGRVAAVLRVNAQEHFRFELHSIHRVVESKCPVYVYPGLQVGRRCRVVSGCLAGVEGTVLRWRSTSRLYIAATILQQSAVIEIDCALLEPVDE